MNTILQTHAAVLTQAIRDDPLRTLANAVAWLDPLWKTSDDDLYDEGESVELALCITRSAFPEIYVGAVKRICSGAPERGLDSFICGEISQRGILLDNLEFLGWGIPLDAVGIDLEDPDFYAALADLQPALAYFGIHWPHEDNGRIDLSDEVYPVGRAIAASLLEQTDSTLRQVDWLCGWLFSYTGNSLVDYTDGALTEIPPLSWTTEDVEFALELIEEADGIMADVRAGREILAANPHALRTLTERVRRCKRHSPEQQVYATRRQRP